MKKVFVLSLFSALFMVAAFGIQDGAVGLGVPAAFADDNNYDDHDGHDSNESSNESSDDEHGDHESGDESASGGDVSDIADDSYACECPPGISACTCADGSAGDPSDDAPTAAGPIRLRSF